VEVRHGVLLNVFGTPARCGSYTIMPSDSKLNGRSFRTDYRLCDHFDVPVPSVLRYPVDQGFDAAWVRARLPSVFGFTPEPTEVEKTLLCVGFAAVTEGGSICYPFICTDHYGRSALMFSDEGPEEAVKRSIADAFWGALVQYPDDLTDFEERVYHPGAMVWLNYGCESGHLYCEESKE
jgi:hypothetical protein